MDITSVVQIAATVLGAIGGGGLIVVGCASWLGRVWASRILEADRLRYGQELERLRSELESQRRLLQGQLDKAIHVHRIHFETEFQALSAIWASLSALRSAMAQLRPQFSIVDQDSDPKAGWVRRLYAFNEKFDAFVRAIDDQSPFYAKDIYDELVVALAVARREHTSVRTTPFEGDKDWWREGRENLAALIRSADKISELIRERLQGLQVHS
jgi:hypothetical protein